MVQRTDCNTCIKNDVCQLMKLYEQESMKLMQTQLGQDGKFTVHMKCDRFFKKPPAEPGKSWRDQHKVKRKALESKDLIEELMDNDPRYDELDEESEDVEVNIGGDDNKNLDQLAPKKRMGRPRGSKNKPKEEKQA